MSVSCVIVCLDCRVAAPPIGDYGFIGWPSIDEAPTAATTEEWDWAEFLPFGCIRRTFMDIGIAIDELEQFTAFIRKHDGHHLGIDSDGELQHPCAGGQQVVDEIEKAKAIPTPLSYASLSDRTVDGFVVGRYTLRCTCGATYSSSQPTVLRPLADVQWTSDLLERFRSRILEIDPCNFWRITNGLLDPGMATDEPPPSLREIESFVGVHLPHGVTGGVVAEAA